MVVPWWELCILAGRRKQHKDLKAAIVTAWKKIGSDPKWMAKSGNSGVRFGVLLGYKAVVEERGHAAALEAMHQDFPEDPRYAHAGHLYA